MLSSLAVAVLLAGCATTVDDADERIEDDVETMVEQTPEPFVTGVCLDGAAALVVDDEHPEVSFLEACDTVSVIGADGDVTLADVGHLVVEGRGLTITTGAVQSIDFAGDENAVAHGGDAPEVAENGTSGNTVTAR